jgi:hypothetical protein
MVSNKSSNAIAKKSNSQREARGGCESTSVWCAVLPREAELDDLDKSFRRLINSVYTPAVPD